MAGNLKLDNLRYGTLNNITENAVHNSGDRRRTTTSTAINKALNMAYQKDTLKGVNEFNGIVVSYQEISYPTYKNRNSLLQEYIVADNNVVGPAADEGDDVDEPQEYANIAYKVYIPETEPRPAPTGNNDPVLISYPDVFSDVATTSPIPLGTIVVVRYEDKETLFNPRIVSYSGKPIGIENISVNAAGESLEIEFQEGRTTVGSPSRFSDLMTDLPEVSSEQTVKGDSFAPLLTGVVEGELDFWSDKKENDEAAYDRLEMYWNNLRQPFTIDTAWSAAFISFVITRVDPVFPSRAGHYFYVEAAKRGMGNWRAFKSDGANILAQVGDILVKPPGAGRTITSGYESHGDIVYKIEDGHAYLAGGNLSSTAKGNIILSVDNDTKYSNFGQYKIILKKNGIITNG